MSTWPGQEVWTPLWEILSTWLPSGKCSGSSGSSAQQGHPFLPLSQQHQAGGELFALQPCLLQLPDILNQSQGGPSGLRQMKGKALLHWSLGASSPHEKTGNSE